MTTIRLLGLITDKLTEARLSYHYNKEQIDGVRKQCFGRCGNLEVQSLIRESELLADNLDNEYVSKIVHLENQFTDSINTVITRYINQLDSIVLDNTKRANNNAENLYDRITKIIEAKK